MDKLAMKLIDILEDQERDHRETDGSKDGKKLLS